MKLCTTCGFTKPFEDFNKNKAKPDGYGSKCRECMKLYRIEYYAINKTELIVKTKKRASVIISDSIEQLREYLSEHPCVDCGTTDIRVLEFDHVRGKKHRAISALLSSAIKWTTILKEIEKCEVRCANCHRIVTHERGNSFRAQWANNGSVV